MKIAKEYISVESALSYLEGKTEYPITIKELRSSVFQKGLNLYVMHNRYGVIYNHFVEGYYKDFQCRDEIKKLSEGMTFLEFLEFKDNHDFQHKDYNPNHKYHIVALDGFFLPNNRGFFFEADKFEGGFDVFYASDLYTCQCIASYDVNDKISLFHHSEPDFRGIIKEYGIFLLSSSGDVLTDESISKEIRLDRLKLDFDDTFFIKSEIDSIFLGIDNKEDTDISNGINISPEKYDSLMQNIYKSTMKFESTEAVLGALISFILENNIEGLTSQRNIKDALLEYFGSSSMATVRNISMGNLNDVFSKATSVFLEKIPSQKLEIIQKYQKILNKPKS